MHGLEDGLIVLVICFLAYLCGYTNGIRHQEKKQEKEEKEKTNNLTK